MGYPGQSHRQGGEEMFLKKIGAKNFFSKKIRGVGVGRRLFLLKKLKNNFFQNHHFSIQCIHNVVFIPLYKAGCGENQKGGEDFFGKNKGVKDFFSGLKIKIKL